INQWTEMNRTPRRPRVVVEPLRAPEVRDRLPGGQRTSRLLKRVQKPFLAPNLFDGVVRFISQRTPEPAELLQVIAHTLPIEQWQMVVGTASSLPCRRSKQVVNRCTGEAVADPQVMIEKREWPVVRERCQPQRQSAKLDGHRIDVDAE